MQEFEITITNLKDQDPSFYKVPVAKSLKAGVEGRGRVCREWRYPPSCLVLDLHRFCLPSRVKIKTH